ncbi:hypothetical protein GP486_003004 [Trichoglossum hirsutum]|uniref:DUF6590 domain-containing protein n=1 Tax=Trichoglossum hirsutum TaxID=265104 RepID=A0A9P8RR57_9PEZI|nr:hypothetical protein GP486_003004 [Trichoglossum hirsutum]
MDNQWGRRDGQGAYYHTNPDGRMLPTNDTPTNRPDPSIPRSISWQQPGYSQSPQLLQYHQALWKHHETQADYHQSLDQYYRGQQSISPQHQINYYQQQRDHHLQQSYFHQQQAANYPNDAQTHHERAKFHQEHMQNYEALMQYSSPQSPQRQADSHRDLAEYHSQLVVYYRGLALPHATQTTSTSNPQGPPTFQPPYQQLESPYPPPGGQLASVPVYQPPGQPAAGQPYQQHGTPYPAPGTTPHGTAYPPQGEPGLPNQVPPMAPPMAPPMSRNYTHTSSGTESMYPQRQPYIRIEGTPGDTDLDPEYVIQRNPRKYFVFGRVFSVLWTEPAGVRGNGTKYTVVRFGQCVFTEIRRFVVVNEMHDSCWCLPIHSYGRQGALKRSANPDDHAIIHTSEEVPRPLDGELLAKRPLRVIPDSPENRLDPMSRINFGKVYTVEHNIKVKKLGKIADDSKHLLDAYFRAYFPSR